MCVVEKVRNACGVIGTVRHGCEGSDAGREESSGRCARLAPVQSERRRRTEDVLAFMVVVALEEKCGQKW